jgi:hypothetical protein
MLTKKAKTIYVFYRHSRETNEFLQSNRSVNRPNYFRILALACIDIALTLPLGISLLVLSIIPGVSPFYYGWSFVHSNWGPVAVLYSDMPPWFRYQLYVQSWISPFLSIIIFALLGTTPEACATYWRGIHAVGKRFGYTPPAVKHNEDLGKIQFGTRQMTMSGQWVSQSSVSDLNSLHLCIGLVRALLCWRMEDKTLSWGTYLCPETTLKDHLFPPF